MAFKSTCGGWFIMPPNIIIRTWNTSSDSDHQAKANRGKGAVPPGWQPDLIYLASPASVSRQLRRPPPNFQTDLSSYSEIVLPPLLARGAVALLALVRGIFFRHSSVHIVFYPCSDIGRYLEGAARPDGPTGSWRRYRHVSPPPSGRCYRRQLAPNGEIILVCVCRLGLEKGSDFLARVAVQLVAVALSFKLLITTCDGCSSP
ncbi:hypothetical protein V8E54_009270 [Elaphomyces granulatus]